MEKKSAQLFQFSSIITMTPSICSFSVRLSEQAFKIETTVIFSRFSAALIDTLAAWFKYLKHVIKSLNTSSICSIFNARWQLCDDGQLPAETDMIVVGNEAFHSSLCWTTASYWARPQRRGRWILCILFGFQWHRQRAVKVCDWSACTEGNTPVSVAQHCDESRLMAVKWTSMSSQRLRDLFSLITSPQILYPGSPATCEKHINRECLIPAAALKLNNPQTKQNENCPTEGPWLTEQSQTGKIRKRYLKFSTK